MRTGFDSSSFPTTVLAALVIIGSFSYFIVRGGSDVAIIAILSASLGSVLSFAFAGHIANGAAEKALTARIASTNANNVVISETPNPDVATSQKG